MSAKLHRLRAITPALALALAPLAPTSSRAAPPELVAREGEAELRPVLVLMTEPDEIGDAVARAIATELNDVDVTLEALALPPASSLGERIEAGEALVREREALGLIWVEARADGLVVHLTVADAGMLRRPIVGLEDRRQAIETAAVVVRHFALDLLAGRPIGLIPFAAEPEPVRPREPTPLDPAELPAPERDPSPAPPPVDPWLADRGHFRLQAGYLGQTWIRERAWEHGVEVNAGWRAAIGAHVELGVGVAPAFELELVHPAKLGAAQLRVRRFHQSP